MAGLLDWLQTPAGMGLLSAAATGLAGARKGTPLNNVGRGALGGLVGYSQAQDQLAEQENNVFSRQLKQMQMDQMTRQMTDQQKMREGLQALYKPAAPFQADNPFGEDLGKLQTEASFAGKPVDPVMGAVLPYAQPDDILKMFGPQANENKFGKVMPHNYTPESLARYQQSGNFADLSAVGGNANFGNVNPGQFTPESLATYQQTGDYADLVPFRAPIQIDQGDRKILVNPGTGRVKSYSVAPKITDTPQYQAEQERAKGTARAEVEATTTAKTQAPANVKAISTLDRLDADIQTVIDHPGLKYAVGPYSVAPIIPGTPQADAFAAIQNLADRAAVGAIQEMKAASKTGGAVGAISEKEWPKLEAQMVNVNRAQSYPQFKKELQKFQALVRESKRQINAAQQAAGGAPKAVKKYNPATGRIE